MRCGAWINCWLGWRLSWLLRTAHSSLTAMSSGRLTLLLTAWDFVPAVDRLFRCYIVVKYITRNMFLKKILYLLYILDK